MWMVQLYQILFTITIISNSHLAICNAITNLNLRDYYIKDDNNITNVKTLQKEEPGKYANLAAARNPIRFKEVPDNALSSSSYSRGLLNHDLPVYQTHYHDDSPHHGYGYEYHDADHHEYPYDHHGHGHYIHSDHHDGHHHLNYGHHYKHHDHALATKTILWPIAGLALLGAAAALVSNPVLLQLGVVSGRRKRHAEELPVLDDSLRKLTDAKHFVVENQVSKVENAVKYPKIDKIVYSKPDVKTLRRLNERARLRKHTKPLPQVTVNVPNNYDEESDERFIPVPIKIKNL